MQRKNISKTKQDGNKLQKQAKFKRSDNSANVRKTSAGRGRINLRAQPPEAVFNLPKTLRENKSKRPLSSGRGSSSRTRFANGSSIRQACGRNDKTGPCFDLNIPPNGYGWWYMDGLSDDGTKAVSVIAFIGSVFSPWYSWSGRKNPHDFCSINIVTYGKGGRWTMTERRERHVQITKNSFKVGPSKLEWDGKKLVLEFSEITIPHLDKIEGSITLTPESVNDLEVLLKPDGTHVWRPFSPISRLDIKTNKKGWNWQGNAYLDGNFGTRALEQDFNYWTWSRLPFKDKCLTFYDADLVDGSNTNIALSFKKDGTVEQVEAPPLQPITKTKWLLKRVARSDKEFSPYQSKALLDAPFYSRSELVTQIFKEKTTGVHETLNMKRFTNPFIKPLLCAKIPRIF